MLIRTLLLKLHPEHKDKKKQLIEEFLTMSESIPEMLSAEAYENVIADERAYDIIYKVSLKDQAAWEIYDTHPIHMKFREKLHAWLVAISAVTYEGHE